MIITRTPFRISFAGGGTDLQEYYRHEEGLVLSTTINKYMYLTVNDLSDYFDHRLRIAYSKVEMVYAVEEIQHPLVREALKLFGIKGGIDIHSMADVPSGTGLGSSSSYTVGLINALNAYQGKISSPEFLAGEACNIEIEKVKDPIGKQDQYAAAYGGLNTVRFLKDETVLVEPLPVNRDRLDEFWQHLMLFYTGIRREARDVLRQQKSVTNQKIQVLSEMKGLALQMRDNLLSDEPIDKFGKLLHESWLLKKSISPLISESFIDACYDQAIAAGAEGGKILGAGAGGFLLLFVKQEYQASVRNALRELKEVHFQYEPLGSQIIYAR